MAYSGVRVGSRMRAARVRQGMSTDTLAKALRIGVTTLRHIERDETQPSLRVFVAALNVLGLGPDRLLSDRITKAELKGRVTYLQHEKRSSATPPSWIDNWVDEVKRRCLSAKVSAVVHQGRRYAR